MRKVVYVCLNHIANKAGGAETYTHELYEAVRDSGEFEAFLVSKVGPPYSIDTPHQGTRFSLANRDPGEYYIYTHKNEFNTLFWSAFDKRLYTDDWRDFLRLLEPDIVHFQHLNWLGFDMVRETRSSLPNVPLVYTLHEFEPICFNRGQMVRTKTNELCHASSPRRCHQCFPAVPVESFFLRERFIKSALELIDMFIAPSEFLRQRYIEWGIPPDKIRTEDYGRLPVTPIEDPPDAGRRRRIGFLGRPTFTKGLDVLLEAMKILEEDDCRVKLLIGAEADVTELGEPEAQNRVRRLIDETSESTSFIGPYAREEVPGIYSAVDWVIVPSVWWENSPCVIQEAMMHHRPVICSDIGGMAEKVRDGVTGLHFRVGDAHSLAEKIRRAVDSPELWDEMRGHIKEPHPMATHFATITGLYEELLAGELPAAPHSLALRP